MRPSASTLAFALLYASAAGMALTASACSRSAAPKKPNVVLITADTLRADHLSCYGYFRRTSPAIDALAGESLLFERVVVPIATTLPSHVSLMTSTSPQRHGVLWNKPFRVPERGARRLRLAAELFADAGYATAAFTSATPVNEISGIQAGFQTFEGVPAAGTGGAEKPAEQTMDAALEWLARARSPFFLWIHLFDPHAPYAPPAPFDEAFGDEPPLFAFFEERHFPPGSIARAARNANGYDGEILYMDGQIRRLLDRLRESGLYDDALIVFTGDHGEGLMQHRFEGHGIVWNEQLLVPLLIKPPKASGVATRRSAALASLLDVLPTMARVANLPIDARQFDGISLVDASRRSVLSQQQWSPGTEWRQRLFTLTTERWKYFHYRDGSARDRLFDLVGDPHELRDVIDEHADAGEHLRLEAAELSRAGEKDRAFVSDAVPDAVREQLRQLGYVD